MNIPSSRTLPSLIEELAAEYPDRYAVTGGDVTLSFAQIRRLAFDFAKALYADGVRKGDKVAILMGNRREWLVTHFAVQYLGATTVALNTWYTAPELAYVIDHADVTVLLAVDRFLRNDYVQMLGSLQPVEQRFPLLRRIVLLGDTIGDNMVSYEAFLQNGAIVSDDVIHAARNAVAPSDIALLLYTSGSTARPKGVTLQHIGLIQNCFDIGERQHFDSDDVMLLPISLFWGMGCSNALMAAWTHGMHIVLQEHFEAGDALRLIEQHKCTALYGTPNIIEAVLEHPERGQYDIGSLRKGIAGRSAHRVRRLIDEIIPMACQCYGFTEGYGNSTVTDASDPPEKRHESVGRVLPGSELRIVEPQSGALMPAGATGEIRIRGLIMPGYYKQPQVTEDSFDADGFFKTGDLGLLDEDGFLYFKGRLKEMIKTGGMNVSPAEVEEVLRAHPCVEEAFVTGVPDPIREEAVAAIVVLSDGAAVGTEEIINHCRASLAIYKVPRHVSFVKIQEVPLTSTGKVHKARLVELFPMAEGAPK